MMCSARLMRRFPARESRWRFWSPEEASRGAVPFQEAKWARLANRAMSPMSPSRRAAPDGPMPCQVHQPAAGAVDQVGEFLFRDLDLLVDDDEFGDQLGGQPAAGLADHVARADGAQQGAGLLGGQELLRPAGHQLQQQVVQPVDHVGAGAAELVTAVDQQPQRDRGVVGDDLPQTFGAQGDHGDAVGIDRVGLAALAGGEHPRPGRQLRRHVHHGLAVGDQALSDVPADAVAALDRPQPVLVLAAGGEHGLVAVAVGAEPALPDGPFPAR